MVSYSLEEAYEKLLPVGNPWADGEATNPCSSHRRMKMVRSWALTAADGHVVQDGLALRPDQAREWIDEVDAIAPHNAPHFVALEGGEEA